MFPLLVVVLQLFRIIVLLFSEVCLCRWSKALNKADLSRCLFSSVFGCKRSVGLRKCACIAVIFRNTTEKVLSFSGPELRDNITRCHVSRCFVLLLYYPYCVTDRCVSLNNGFGQFHAKVNLTMKKYVFTKRISLYFMALTCFNRNLKEITVYPPHMRGATKVK